MTPCSQGLNSIALWFQEGIPIKDIPVTAQGPRAIYNNTSIPSLSLPSLFSSLSTGVISECSLSSPSGYKGPSCQTEQNKPQAGQKEGQPPRPEIWKHFWVLPGYFIFQHLNLWEEAHGCLHLYWNQSLWAEYPWGVMGKWSDRVFPAPTVGLPYIVQLHVTNYSLNIWRIPEASILFILNYTYDMLFWVTWWNPLPQPRPCRCEVSICPRSLHCIHRLPVVLQQLADQTSSRLHCTAWVYPYILA